MNSDEVLELPGPDDFHLHLRSGPKVRSYVRTISAACSRALIMPNTVPPVATPEGLSAYRAQIRDAAPNFEPLMSFKLLPSLDERTIAELAHAGAIAGKYYPVGVTTNAEDGIRDPEQIEGVLAVMEELDLVLCVHAENPEADVFEREREFLPVIERIVARHSRLRIVVEHVSDARTVAFVKEMPATVAATVTAHHLLLTVEDLLGSGIRPHLYCKPLLKSRSDRKAIERVVLAGEKRFFFGSDSAPHPVVRKECARGAAGVYSAPTAVPLLISFFENHGVLPILSSFVGANGAAFYRLPPSSQVRRFLRRRWRVPDTIDGVVPLGAGEELAWQPETATWVAG